MIRGVILALMLSLGGCQLAPSLLIAGAGVVAGELQLGSAVINYMGDRISRVPTCGTPIVPPCVIRAVP